MDGSAGTGDSSARGPALAAPDAVRCDAAVVGGGLVGAAVARGLAGRGLSTVILDEGDVAHRASRGNFALVWVQSKGLGMARYGAWTRLSSDAWAEFARELRDETGTDVAHRRPGGFSLALSEVELEKRQSALVRMHNQPGWIPYHFEVLDRAAVRREFPYVGPDVAGGVFCPLDGVVVFDHHIGGKWLQGVEVIFLTGLGVSERTLGAIERSVADGATCVSLPDLLPPRVRERTGDVGTLEEGQGCWVATRDFAAEHVREHVAHVIPQEDAIRYRFGDHTVTIRPVGGDPNRLAVSVD